MPTIKHVGTHVDDLHDGRPIVPYATVDLTDDEFALTHYQSRLADGSLLLVPDEHRTDAPTQPVSVEPSVTSDETPENPSETPEDDLDDLTVAELREQAETAGLELPKTVKKPDLIQALRQHAPTQED